MFRSPISPASFCTSARSSSRNATSSGESAAAFEIFLPGILTPNHQSNANTAATTMAMRSALERILKKMSPIALQRGPVAANVPMKLLGSARVSRAGCGVSPQQSFLEAVVYAHFLIRRKVRDGEDALASTRDACATQSANAAHHAIFLRKRSAQ